MNWTKPLSPIVWALALLLQSAPVQAQPDTLRLLFVGDTLSTGQNLPAMLSQLAQSRGKVLLTASAAPAYSTLQDHWQSSSTQGMASQHWDYLVLQEQQVWAVTPYHQMQHMLPFGQRWIDSLCRRCVRPLLAASWPPALPGRYCAATATYCTHYFSGRGEFQDSLNAAYRKLAQARQVPIAPVGEVWRYLGQHYPGLWPYAPDSQTANALGAYTAACTYYASLYRESPVGSSFRAGLDSLSALHCQQAAWAVVGDSLARWNLDTLPLHAAFTLQRDSMRIQLSNTSSSRACGFRWHFGDGSTSTLAAPSHTYTQPGKYQVLLKAWHLGCDTVQASDSILVLRSQTYPAAMVGPDSLCGQAGYSISPLPQVSGYQWAVPAGWQLLSGQGSAYIVVQAGNTAGWLSVSAPDTNGLDRYTTRKWVKFGRLPSPGIDGDDYILNYSNPCTSIYYPTTHRVAVDTFDHYLWTTRGGTIQGPNDNNVCTIKWDSIWHLSPAVFLVGIKGNCSSVVDSMQLHISYYCDFGPCHTATEPNAWPELRVYPNPGEESVWVEALPPGAQASLYTSQGKRLGSFSTDTGGRAVFYTQALSPGQYVLLLTQDGKAPLRLNWLKR